MDCPHLIAPVNAFVVLPCIEQFTSSCSVVCDNGFHVSNTSSNMWTQQCVLDDSVNGSSVQWTEAKSCVGKCEDRINNNPFRFSNNIYFSKVYSGYCF